MERFRERLISSKGHLYMYVGLHHPWLGIHFRICTHPKRVRISFLPYFFFSGVIVVVSRSLLSPIGDLCLIPAAGPCEGQGENTGPCKFNASVVYLIV